MKQVINADPHGKVTLQGYDPVAFHAIGAAMRGNPSILLEYGGYKYLFSSEENKKLFEKDPERYLPAYGGFCAFGVSLGVLFPIEIDTWEIINGRLVLQFSQEFKKIFEENTDGNIKQADENWRKIEAA
jgi:YHS domain-containing protein